MVEGNHTGTKSYLNKNKITNTSTNRTSHELRIVLRKIGIMMYLTFISAKSLG